MLACSARWIAVDRRVGANSGRDLCQAELEIGIAGQQREDPAAPLRAQDGQERGRAVYPPSEEHSSIVDKLMLAWPGSRR